MDSRYKKLNPLSLSDVEKEIDLLINLIGERIPTDREMNDVSGLIRVAKALGTTRKW